MFAASSRTKSTFSSARTGTFGPEGLLGVALGPYDPHALAVVPAAHGLEDDREAAHLRGEGRRVGGVGHDAVARAGRAQLGEPGAHHPLVLGVDERVGTRAYGDAVRLQRAQMLDRHVLVVERDHVTPSREVTQRGQVVVVADDHIADHLGRGVLGVSLRSLNLRPRGMPASWVIRAS